MTINPRIQYNANRARPLSNPGDDTQLLSNFYQYYKSLDLSEQLWAIDQIPLNGVSGGPFAVLQCFEFFSENLNMDEPELLKCIHAAISRELIRPVLKPEDRFKFVLPITIKCFKSNICGKWIHLLHRICKMIKSSFQQLTAFEKITDLINECNHFSDICAAHMIAGLCEAGATIPNSIINQLIDHVQIFELCYVTVFNSVLSKSSITYANNIIEQLLQNNPSEGPLLQAALSIHFPIPEQLKIWINSVLLENQNPSTDIVSVIAKNKNRLIQQEIFTEHQVMQIVWSSGLFTPQYFDIMSDYFQKSLPFMKESDSLSFLKRICQSESIHSIKLSILFLKNAKSKQSINYVISFLSSPYKSYSQFQEFVKSFDIAVNIVSAEHSNSLTQCLLKLLSNEVTIGHVVAKDGTKILCEFDPKKVKKNSPTFVKGWREMSQMIEALSCSPSKLLLKEKGIQIIKEALNVHTNPLIPSIVTFLNSISEFQEAIFDFFDFLLSGGSSKQIFLIEVIQKVSKNLEVTSLFNRIGLKLAKLAISDSPVNVKIAIVKLFPKFLSFGKDFTSSRLNSVAVSVFHKIQNEPKLNKNDGYLIEVTNSLKNEYAAMERAASKSLTENVDWSNLDFEEKLKPVSMTQKKVAKRSRSIGIKLKPQTVIKPVPSHSKLLPRV